MDYSSNVALLLLRTAILDMLMSGEAYGLPLPIILRTAKQLGQGVLGTGLVQAQSTGFTKDLLFQFATDSRNLHLWVLSSLSPEDFALRFIQYLALETVGVSFGHLKYGAGAIATGGFRNFVAQELAPAIASNATHVKRVLDIEKSTIALLAYCGSKGKTQCRTILEVIRKLRAGYTSPPLILKPATSIDPIMIQFHNSFKIVFDNMVREHTLRRYLNGCAQKMYSYTIHSPLVNPTVIPATISLNIPAIIDWSIFGVTVTGFSIFALLNLFQRAERRRYNNYQGVIDVIPQCVEDIEE